MKTFLTIEKTSLTIVLFLLFFSNNAFALEVNNPINEYDSIYKYNALENKNSFPNLATTDDPTSIISTVKELPKVNDLSNDVLKGLQDVSEKHNFSAEQIDNAISSIKSRSGLKTFLVGNSLGVLKFQLAQTKDQILTLNALTLKTTDSTMKIQIDSQIKLLQEEQVKVENFLLEQNNKFPGEFPVYT